MNKILSIVLLSFVMASTAVANMVISPGITHVAGEDRATTPAPLTTDSKSNETVIDLRVGYVMPMGLYLGGMYSSISRKAGSVSGSGNLLGPTIGYYSYTGFYTLLTYHISGKDKAWTNMGEAVDVTGAKGPQVDVGWVFPVSTYFSLGPQITWRSLEFSKAEGNGASLDTNYKRTNIAPYLSLWFMF